ncbi:GWxTD domain-containing protein [candidate division WOR-3 bacterium]|nr:GWxTD domain-containing protein [candidate division WOR-3 bacterium]
MFGAIILTIISSLFVSEGDIRFYVQTSRYLDRSGVTWLEMYINVPSNPLYSSVNLNLDVVDENDSTRMSTSWPLEIPSTGTDYSALDNFSIDLTQAYTLKITLTETMGTREGRISFRASPLEQGTPLSDIFLSKSVSASSDSGFLVKNGLLIYPLFDREMTVVNPKLIVYYEVYPQTDSINVISSVLDSEENEVWKYTSFIGDVESGGYVGKVINVPIGDFEDGDYTFKIYLNGVERTEKFSVNWQPVDIAQETVQMEMSDLAQKYYTRIEMLLTVNQLQVYEILEEEAKDNLARIFWSTRDPNPMTPINEELELFAERMDYAEEHYSSGFETGSESDRGRIYIQNGKPEEIEIIPADDHYVPNEIWIYWRYGRKYVFADMSGHGVFELVYSNDPNETNHPNWEKYTNENIGDIW